MKNTTKLFATTALVLGSFLNSNAQTTLPAPGFLGPDRSACIGYTGIGISPTYPDYGPNWTYLWSTGETTPIIGYAYLTGDSTYTVWLQVTLGNQSVTDTLHIDVWPEPAYPLITLSSETACADSIVISTQPQPGFFLSWYVETTPNIWTQIPGQTGTSYTVSSTDKYQIRSSVQSNGTCYHETDTTITISGTPSPFMNDTTFCQTNGAPYTVSDNVNNGNYTYTWLQGNATVNPNQVQTSTRVVNIKNANNCSINDTMVVNVNPLPTPNFTNDVTTCGEFVTLKDLGNNTNYNYVWAENNSVLSTTDSLSVNHTGEFNVKTTNQFGCSVKDTLYVIASASVDVNGYNAIPNIPNNPKSFQFYALAANNVTNYLWDFGDGTTSTLESPTHIFANGVNSSLVTLTVSNDTLTGDCAFKTISLNLDVSGTTSIDDLNVDYALNVYPNPANSIVNVKVGKGNITNVTITDIVGKVIYSHNSNASNISMDLSTISSGLHIVKATVKDGSNEGVVTRKIVKQ